jgi:hypothetical protein
MMTWIYFLLALGLFTLSAGCIVSTMMEVRDGNIKYGSSNYIGATVFHGLAGLLAIYFLLKGFHLT